MLGTSAAPGDSAQGLSSSPQSSQPDLTDGPWEEAAHTKWTSGRSRKSVYVQMVSLLQLKEYVLLHLVSTPRGTYDHDSDPGLQSSQTQVQVLTLRRLLEFL